MNDRAAHWDEVHDAREAEALTWYQAHPTTSLEMLEATGVAPDAAIVDVGGGASLLVDRLLERGHEDLTVLDVSGAALAVTRERLGPKAGRVLFVESNVLDWAPRRPYRIWHDRALFHFLVDPDDRGRYMAVLSGALAEGGWAVVATFGPEGPETCSGLPVVRYDARSLVETLIRGTHRDVRLIDSRLEDHRTPAGRTQQFLHVLVRLD